MSRAAPVMTPQGVQLLIPAVSLAAVGLIAISSAGIDYGDHHHGNPWYLAIRHGVYLVLAVVCASAAYFMPVSIWRRAAPGWLLMAAILLVLVLIPGIGRDVNGSHRWLPLGPLTLQPSEIAKFAMVIYIASYLERHGDQLRAHWLGLAKPIGLLGGFGILLLLEPDLGATVIVFGTVFGMLFIGGARLLHVAALVITAIGALVLLVVSEPYRLRRLTAYQDPWQNPFGEGFQLIQSLIAYGRGEWFGVGIGNSVQKLFYLPEAHTDFVFSIWAEETGFFGTVLVILMFCALVTQIIRIGIGALRREESFPAYVCFGVALVFAGQIFINIGVSSGLLPTKGLTLPLVSYGGSSLIVSAVMLALVARVSQQPATNPRGRR